MRAGREQRRSSLFIMAALFLMTVTPLGFQARGAAAGPPLFPDLQAQPPGDPYLDTVVLEDGLSHRVIRFDSVIGNHGGRLEIVANLDVSRDLYQNAYDQKTGGNLVYHQRITADLIFHPQHNHFHFSNFAAYNLLKKNSRGAYKRTTRGGSKTSFCMLDSIKVDPNGASIPGFTECSAKRQGLSSGWADLYGSGLYGQWIDLGTSPLSDGDYAIQIVADPLDKIKETNEHNNAGTTFIKIRNGALQDAVAPSFCSSKPLSAPPGTEIFLFCARLVPNETFDIRWRYTDSPIVDTATSNAQGALTASFVMPPASSGAHYLYFSSRQSSKQYLALVETAPGLKVSPTLGVVGTPFSFNLGGFSSGESVDLTYETSLGVFKTLATIVTDTNGAGSGSSSVPTSSFGSHRVVATGRSSHRTSESAITVDPSLKLSISSGAAGSQTRPSMRGFGSHETVILSVQGSGAILATLHATSAGSVTGSLVTELTIPLNQLPGSIVILAKGQTSGAIASAGFTVTNGAPTPTPTATRTPTATVTRTPTSSPSATATTPSSPTASPTATASVTPSSTATTIPTPTETATTEPTATSTTTP